MQSESRKTERAAEKARDQDAKEKAPLFIKCIQSGVFLKQPQPVSLVQTRRKRKSLKTEPIKSTDEQDEEDEIPEGGKPSLPQYAESGRFPGIFTTIGAGV